MAPLKVSIKHAGKVHSVPLDPDLPPSAFKEAIYQVTGVPVDRMKVMIKGGVLKDDSDWTKIAPKEGQTFMVIGAAGELPKPPEKPIVFLEDMDDAELAEALAKPVGLINLGNTCYMNATIQALRAIPELSSALVTSDPSSLTNRSPNPLPVALSSLLTSMAKTTEPYTPAVFLNVLRQVNPRFAETDRSGAKPTGMMQGFGAGYAQQDAEECYGEIINSLRGIQGIPNEGGPQKTLLEQFMMGRMKRVLKCTEAPEEEPSISEEDVLKIECNITITTNYMANGILNSLTQTVSKRSATLGREAEYTQTSRLTRLPQYLTVHMVRFAWRADINKRTKIMRRIKFPEVYDAIELTSDELKVKLEPVSNKLKEFEKGRAERRKVRKRTKKAAEQASSGKGKAPAASSADAGDVEMADASASTAPTAEGEESKEKTSEDQGGDLAPEEVYREREGKELEALVDPELKKDIGCSVHGLYELVAIVTHKGAAANSGHYIGFVKKSVFHGRQYQSQSVTSSSSAAAGSSTSTEEEAASTSTQQKTSWEDEEDEDWYKFDDQKVSVFPREKLPTLEGGGEDSSAYVLLYRSKPLV